MGPDFFKRLEEEWLDEENKADAVRKKSLREQEIKKREQEALKARLSTAQGRFWWRIETWEAKKGSAAEHHFWWFVHNCVAHPLIGVLPVKSTFDFHDYTSDKINCK